MGIFDRMGKVISSNVNALLDKAEDPKKSLDLIVEEMKEQIRAAKKELVEGVAADKVLRKKVDELLPMHSGERRYLEAARHLAKQFHTLRAKIHNRGRGNTADHHEQSDGLVRQQFLTNYQHSERRAA